MFSIYYNGTNTPYRVNVAGVGLGGAIALATNALAYAAAYSGASPAAQTVRLANGGVGVFGYTNEIVYGSGAKDWLTAQPAAGIIHAAGAQTLTFAVNSAGLGLGIYTATNYVIAADATNSPQAVVVTLTIWLPPPVWLAPAPVGAGQFTLNWEAPEVGDGYWLEVAPTADFRGLTVGTNIVGQAVRSFDVVHVGAGSTNYCRIKTLRGAIAGSFSDVLKVVASAGAPYPVDRIPLWQTVTVGGSNTWDLGTLFAGSGLTFAVTSAAPAVVGVKLQTTTATFSYLTVGTSAVTISARNAAGLSSVVTVMFDVTPRDGVGLAAGTPQFVPKLNVYAQTVWVTNNTGSTVSAIKLSVKGILPAKTTLREATSQTGTDAVLLWNGALAAGEAVQFNLTFLNPALTQVTVGSIVSEFSVVALVPAVTFDPAPVKIANLGATRDLSGVGIAGFLLEFPTKKGAICHIFYRDSLTGVDWVRVLKPVTALGTWQMWYDTGAPVTAPLGGARFYKVQKQQ